MRIAELARRAALPERTVRFYADERLITPTKRTKAGYREFDAGALRQLAFLRKVQRLGLALPEIRALLRAAERASCGDTSALVRAQLTRQLGRIESQIHELEAVRHELKSVTDPTATECNEVLCLCSVVRQGARSNGKAFAQGRGFSDPKRRMIELPLVSS